MDAPQVKKNMDKLTNALKQVQALINPYIKTDMIHEPIKLTYGEMKPLFLECHFLLLQLATAATAIIDVCILHSKKELHAQRATTTFTRYPSEADLEALNKATAHVDYWKSKLWIFRGYLADISRDGPAWKILLRRDPDVVSDNESDWAPWSAELDKYDEVFS